MDKQQKMILIAVGALVLVALIAWIVVMTVQVRPVRGEFIAPSFEENALVGAPEEPLPPQYGRVTVNDDFAFGITASPTLSGNDLAIYLASPTTNTVWMLVRIYDESGNLLGESGLIRPGEYLPSVTLTAQPTGLTVRASVLSYEPETYYSCGSANATLHIQDAR